MDTLDTFWENITHHKTESVDFLGLLNSATKWRPEEIRRGLPREPNTP